jgi:hypothetical protein
MSFLLFLILIMGQLYANYVSAVPLCFFTARPQIWDMQRATNFDALLEATLKDTPHVLDINHSSRDNKLASLRSTKATKRNMTLRELNAKHQLSITKMPMGGMQCAVM